MMENNEMTFEEKLERLDKIVKLLEKGDAPLAESLGLFEEGTGLIRDCSKQLDEAEQKVVELRKGPDGAPVEEPYVRKGRGESHGPTGEI